jgi:hypothetical protein
MRAIKKFLKQFQIVREVHHAIKAPQIKRRVMALAAIENVSLPANLEFQKNADAVRCIEGMFSPFSIAVMDMIWSFRFRKA